MRWTHRPCHARKNELLREVLPDRRRVGVIQFGVRLHLSEFCDTPLGDERVDVCGCELELESHQGISKDRLTEYLRAFQLRRELYRKPGREALKHAVKATL